MTHVEQMEALRAENETLKEQAAAAATLQSEIDGLKARIAEAVAEKESATAEAEKAKAECAEKVGASEKQLAEITAAKAAVDAELVQARAQLANPAYKHAAAAGLSEGTPEGGAASEQGSLWAQYRAMKDGREKTRFYRENKAAMDAEAGR